MLILAIETSCDETAAAVVKNGYNVLSNVVHSQTSVHEKYGGVVPEVASRMHIENISSIVDEALNQAKLTLDQIDAIGVTYTPGLIGALLVGVSYAKALSFALTVPLIAVHHIEGHICACYINNKNLTPPFLCLVVSGGHSHIILTKSFTEYEVIARTLDDAAGETFDKGARALGLGYPGGPAISNCAKNGNPNFITFPRVNGGESGLDFSFSGVKTSLINYLNTNREKSLNKPDIAASFQSAIVNVLSDHLISAAKKLKINKIAIAGGVAANSTLRSIVKQQAQLNNLEFFCPHPTLCTDNACMIACAAYHKLEANILADITLNPLAHLSL